MTFRQVRQFNPAKMGKTPKLCLQNCRLGFGITKGTFASAKLDMESQKKNGTLHAGVPPADISVPVYCDTLSQYEHVVVWHKGVVYEDGYVRSRGLSGLALFGWGELCDGVRVVEPYNAPTSDFLPAKGWWGSGDNDARVGRLASFMRKTFPAYTPAAALGNYFGPNLKKAITEFQRRTGLQADGNVGPITFNKLKSYGFGG